MRNSIMMDKVIYRLQSRLLKLEASEMEELSKSSQDLAVKLALQMASEPAPPMPDFPLDSKYTDAEKLADAVDDTLASLNKDDYLYGSELSDPKYTSTKDKDEPAVSDSEAKTACLDWKSKYEVVPGVSWGKLPYDLQQKWMKYTCDQHIAK